MRLAIALLMFLALGSVAVTNYRIRVARLRQMRRLIHTMQAPWGATHPVPKDPVDRLLPRWMIHKLHLLGIEPGMRGVVLTMGALLSIATIALLVLGPIAAAGLATTSVAGALMMLNLLAGRRLVDLAALMPSFFDRIRQLVIVGNSLPTAFTRSVQDAQPRLARAFAPAMRRMGNGASFVESIRQSAEEIDLYEVRLFATAVAANMRFGGSLAHCLGNLVSYLRKRTSIERELRANTAQIRASAWVLGLLPLLVAGLIVTQNQDYARWFVVHPTGRMMLVYCILSQLCGAIAMRAVVRSSY
jgi:tight adherence protein B